MNVARLEKFSGTSIDGRINNNIQYVDETSLIAKNIEDLTAFIQPVEKLKESSRVDTP